MLYLPPNVPHNGVAVNPCLTFSFGMRAPSSAELISDYLDDLVADADESIRFQDPDLKLPEDPNEIDEAANAPGLRRTETLGLNSMIRSGEQLRLGDLRALGDGFPLRGSFRIIDRPGAVEHDAVGIPLPGTAWMSRS